MTAQVVNLREYTIAQMKIEIHKNFATQQEADVRSYRARIRAGRLLLSLRERIEAGEAGTVGWWDWYKANIVRSRRDAEKVMKIALADDPEAAAEEERREIRERVQLHRESGKAQQNQVRRTVRRDRGLSERQLEAVRQALQLIKDMNKNVRRALLIKLKEAFPDEM